MEPPLSDVIAGARAMLAAAGLESSDAALDADVLARHVLGWDRARLLTALRNPAPGGFAGRYLPLVRRRAAREPVAHIVGHREFWGLDFIVTPDVLIPRPETEVIVEEVVRAASAGLRVDRLVDVGTGSGCLAIALAHELPNASVVATDRSAAAVSVARHNARALGVGGRVHFVVADLLHGIRGRVDVIVSNPPYIPQHDLAALARDVVEYEPGAALSPGPTGFEVLERLFADAPAHLAPKGLLVVEFGFGQAAGIGARARDAGWSDVTIRADLQGIPRTAVLRR